MLGMNVLKKSLLILLASILTKTSCSNTYRITSVVSSVKGMKQKNKTYEHKCEMKLTRRLHRQNKERRHGMEWVD